MGFNNKGVDHLVSRIKSHRYPGVLGVNIGKNLTTSWNSGSRLFGVFRKRYSLRRLHYSKHQFTKAPGLRSLQFGESLAQLIAPLVAARDRYEAENGKRVPLAVKIAPDMTDDEIKMVADTLVEQGVDGIIATNTTLSRDAVMGHSLKKKRAD